MALTNYTEKIVYERLRDYIQQHPGEFCTCTHCIEDILAFALNRLPPKYVSSDRGEVLTDYKFAEALDRTRVVTEVIKAIRTVAKNPSHADSI
ncbi:MAG TPA: late competence development ComFB family protein [Verrucomicrobiae bacterium]|nr:late competence development ComFB family protein [Verrucomicrobiae bacterium]